MKAFEAALVVNIHAVVCIKKTPVVSDLERAAARLTQNQDVLAAAQEFKERAFDNITFPQPFALPPFNASLLHDPDAEYQTNATIPTDDEDSSKPIKTHAKPKPNNTPIKDAPKGTGQGVDPAAFVNVQMMMKAQQTMIREIFKHMTTLTSEVRKATKTIAKQEAQGLQKQAERGNKIEIKLNAAQAESTTTSTSSTTASPANGPGSSMPKTLLQFPTMSVDNLKDPIPIVSIQMDPLKTLENIMESYLDLEHVKTMVDSYEIEQGVRSGRGLDTLVSKLKSLIAQTAAQAEYADADAEAIKPNILPPSR